MKILITRACNFMVNDMILEIYAIKIRTAQNADVKPLEMSANEVFVCICYVRSSCSRPFVDASHLDVMKPLETVASVWLWPNSVSLRLNF